MINFEQFTNKSLTEDTEIEDLMEAIELVHVYDKDGKMFGTGELVKTKGKKSLIRWDSSNEEWVDSDLVKLVESKVTLKRRYTENHPAITAGKHAKIRNKMLEAIGDDGKITQEEFDSILKELSGNGKRWMRSNSKYFNVSEEGISLSKFGRKILQSITINEEQPETNNKPLEMKINEAKEETGLMIVGRTPRDNNKISDVLDDMDLYGEWNHREGFWFLPEEEDAYDELEMMLQKEFDKRKINARFEGVFESLTEKTTENPEIWVPGAFDKELSKLPNSQITYEVVKDLAKKHKVFLDDAIKYVEYGWDLDLQENMKTNMKTQFIYESFSEFVNSLNGAEVELNEAFKSMKLASILTGANAMDKGLAKAFYNMAKIQLDKIQDVDIIEMTPEVAKKEKRANAVYLYFTTNEKDNPYAGDMSYGVSKIPGNTLLAITDGSNDWMATGWARSFDRSKKATRNLSKAKRDDSAGFSKSGASAKYGSGISSMKQVVALADRAYCLDLDILRARYSTDTLRDARTAAKKGAIAFKNDKDFKAENLNRYNTIIANRAAKMPIDDMVKNAIDTLANQIKDALAKGEKGRYGDIIVGKSDKGKEAKLNDTSNHMKNILDDFQRYVSYTNRAEDEKNAGYGGDYYAREVKNYAKNITDKIKQIETFTYAW